MKKLIINLNHVEKTGKKLFNTLSYFVKNQKQINSHLEVHGDNVKKYNVINIK